MTKKITTALAAALLLSVQTVAAQAGHQHAQPNTPPMMQHPMMGQGCLAMAGEMGHGMGPMMSGMPGPGALLHAAEALALTAQQKTQLQTLQTRLQETAAPHRQQVMAAQQKMSAIMHGDKPDLAAYETAMKEAMGHMAAMHVAAARAGLEARALLTTDQRARLSNATSVMHGMMCGGRGMMMQHVPK